MPANRRLSDLFRQAVGLLPQWLLAAALVAGLLWGVSVGASANTAKQTEQVELRSATSDTFVDDKGVHETRMYTHPINYQQGKDWLPIDNTLVASDRDGFMWQNSANSFQVDFKDTPGQGFLRLQAPDGRSTVSITPEGASPAAASSKTNPQELSYPDVFTQTDAQYDMLPDGVKETLILKGAGAPDSFVFDVAPLDGNTLTTTQGKDGSVVFYAAGQAGPVFAIPAPVVADSSNGGKAGVDARGKASVDAVTQKDGSVQVTVSIDKPWLSDPDRVFPVYVDPTWTPSTDQQDGYYNETAGGTPNMTGTTLYVGTNGSGGPVYGSAVVFDLGSIPVGATVNSASVNLDLTGCIPGACTAGTTTGTVSMYQITSGWSSSTAWASIVKAPTLLASRAFNAGTGGDPINNFYPLAQSGTNLNTLLASMVAGTTANNGFLLEKTAGPATNGFQFGSSRSTDTAAAPYMDVFWSVPGVVLNPTPQLHANGADLVWNRWGAGNIYTSTISADSPAGYWRLGENFGTIATDSSGNSRNGSLINSPTLSAAGAVVGDTDTAITFNGSTQYADMGNPAAFQGSSGTLEAWIKTSNAGTSYRAIITKPSAVGLYLKANVVMTYDFGTSTDRTTSTNLADSLWHQVALTYQSGVSNGTKIYVDGALALTTTVTVANQSTQLLVGASLSSGTPLQWFAGMIDEPAIYSSVLSASQVLAHYQAGVATLNDFARYEIHRSTDNFVANDVTLATLDDQALQTYRDTTASPGGTFYYKVRTVTSGGGNFDSNVLKAVLPAAGLATMVIQPGFVTTKAKGTYIVGGASHATNNRGSLPTFVLDSTPSRALLAFEMRSVPSAVTITSAQLSLYSFQPNVGASIDVYPLTGDFNEAGASWDCSCYANWQTAGGDYDSTAANTTDNSPDPHWDNWDVTNMVQAWTNATHAEFGFLLKHHTEAGAPSLALIADFYWRSVALRPKLTITYQDPTAQAAGPSVGVNVPTGTPVVGSGPLTPFPSTPVVEDFNQPNGVVSSAIWNEPFFGCSGVDMRYISNQGGFSSGSCAGAEYSAGRYADEEIALDVPTFASSGIYLDLREQSPSIPWGGDTYFILYDPVADQIYVYDPSYTLLLQVAATMGDGDSIGARIQGNNISVWHKPAAGRWTEDGSVAVNYTSTATPGYVGFELSNPSQRVDNAHAGPVQPLDLTGAFPQTSLLDDFNQPNGVVSSTLWNEPFFGCAGIDMRYISNQGGYTSGSCAGAEAAAGPYEDEEIALDVPTFASGGIYLDLRDQSNSIPWGGNSYFILYDPVADTITAYDPSYTTLLTVSVPIADGDSIGARIVADTLSVWHKPSGGSWTKNGSVTVTNATVATPGYVGFELSNASQRVDNAYAGQVHAPLPAPAMVRLTGTKTITAGASDDGSVASVQFKLDGSNLGSAVTSPPYQYSWNTTGTASGQHTLTAVATDNAGNTTTSQPLTALVANSSAPTTSITGATPESSPNQFLWDVTANASDDYGVAKVDFYVDGNQFATDTAPPWAATLNTLAFPAYDGSHTITSRAYDIDGNATTSTGSSITVANTSGTKYKATISTSNLPTEMHYDSTAGSQDAAPITVALTNNSAVNWPTASIKLRYRWLNPDGTEFSNSGDISIGADLGAGGNRNVSVTVQPPSLTASVMRGRFTLRIDLYDTAATSYFAAQGNTPFEQTITVTRVQPDELGLERYQQYDGSDLGSGFGASVNLANGNLAVNSTLSSEPGIGLDTVAGLTYNSLENGSVSPAGNNWSFVVSGLTAFGLPLDIHPNAADTAASRTAKWIGFTDGDGTYHRFDIDASGNFYNAPAGVHVYLRVTGLGDPSYWGLTKPDRTTFYYTQAGYPSSVVDKDGNTLSFTETSVTTGDDAYALAKQITTVTDQGGRTYTITYNTKADTGWPAVRGKIATITDHITHKWLFAYYNDGNLLRVTEQGGSNTDGSYLPDRTVTFTYTNPTGTAPAISSLAARQNPDPATTESTRLYGVIDARGNESQFVYYTSGTPWRLNDLSDRAGDVTSPAKSTNYSYNTGTLVTTVTRPLDGAWQYLFDTSGRVTSIVDPQSNTTAVNWTTDNMVQKVTEPTGGTNFVEYAYNSNGYLTDKWDELRNHTTISYQNQAVDGHDTGNHLSRVTSIVKPDGNATSGNPTDYTTSFDYTDATHDRVQHITDAYGNQVTNAYNTSDGTLASQTLPAVADGLNRVTTYNTYDTNGLPVKTTNAAGAITRASYDDAGNLQWQQDPNHPTPSMGIPGSDVASLYYQDSFGRVGRSSQPKSSAIYPGLLIWDDTVYDQNDNTLQDLNPHYGNGDSNSAPATTTVYDPMDRDTLVTGPRTSGDGGPVQTQTVYDAEGRVITTTTPNGVKTASPTNDYETDTSYDQYDRVYETTAYDATGGNPRITSYCYDQAGDLRSVTGPKGYSSFSGCQAPTVAPSSYTYTTAPYTTKWTYDGAHEQLSEITNDGTTAYTTSKTYDANGTVTQSTDQNGKTTSYSFEDRGLPTQTVTQFDTTPARNITALTAYDALGRVAATVSPRAWDASSITSNMLLNPSYETNTTSWTGVLGSETLASSATQHVLGAKSMQVTTTTGATSGVRSSSALGTLSSGQTYVFQAQVYGAAGKAMSLSVANSSFIVVASQPFAGVAAWQTITLAFTPASSGQYYLQVTRASSGSADTFYVDDARVYSSYVSSPGYDVLDRNTKTNLPFRNGAAYAPNILNAGPLAYWRLGESAGTTAADATGGGHPLTYANATLAQTGPLGTSDTAVSFNGTTSKATTGTSVTTTTGDVSMEAWVYWNGSSAYSDIFYNGNSSSSGYGLFIANTSCAAGTSLVIVEGGKTCSAASTTMPSQQWVHVAAVKSSGMWHLYLNGIDKASSTPVAPAAPSGGTALAVDPQAATHFFNGKIEEAAIYTRALASNEVAAHYQAGLADTQAYTYDGYDANSNQTQLTLPTTQPSLANVTTNEPASLTTTNYLDGGDIYSTLDGSTGLSTRFDYTAQGQQSARWPDTTGQPNVTDFSRVMYWDYLPDGLLGATRDQGGQREVFNYDADANQTSAAEATGLQQAIQSPTTITRSFDGYDALTKTRLPIQGTSSYLATLYTYDLNGNTTQLVSNRTENSGGTQTVVGRVFTYCYNQLDQPTAQSDDYSTADGVTCTTPAGAASDEQLTYTYTPIGLSDTRTLKKGSGTGWAAEQSADNDYYDDGELKQLTNKDGAGTTIEQHTPSYIDRAGIYNDGNRVSDAFTIKNADGGTTCWSATCYAEWTYDARDRLTSDNPGTGSGTDTITLDNIGNVVTETANATARSYTGQKLSSQTVSGSTTKYLYDALGNLDCTVTSSWAGVTCPATTDTHLIEDYTYDYKNRLLAYGKYSAGAATDTAAYVYDALDRPSVETEVHGGTTTISSFQYLGDTHASTKDVITGGTATTKSYSYDAAGERIAITDGASRYSYLYDPHGSVSLLIDQANAVKASYGYTAYGSADAAITKLAVGFTNRNPYGYAGKRFDGGSNTYDMGARRYSAATGRWLQQDIFYGAADNIGLAADPLSQNKYAFTGANPINYVEDDGHYAICDDDPHRNCNANRPAPPPCLNFDAMCPSGASPGSQAGGGTSDSERARDIYNRLGCQSTLQQPSFLGFNSLSPLGAENALAGWLHRPDVQQCLHFQAIGWPGRTGWWSTAWSKVKAGANVAGNIAYNWGPVAVALGCLVATAATAGAAGALCLAGLLIDIGVTGNELRKSIENIHRGQTTQNALLSAVSIVCSLAERRYIKSRTTCKEVAKVLAILPITRKIAGTAGR